MGNKNKIHGVLDRMSTYNSGTIVKGVNESEDFSKTGTLKDGIIRERHEIWLMVDKTMPVTYVCKEFCEEAARRFVRFYENFMDKTEKI